MPSRRSTHQARSDTTLNGINNRGQIAIDGFDRQSKHRSSRARQGPLHRAHSPRRADRLARRRHRRPRPSHRLHSLATVPAGSRRSDSTAGPVYKGSRPRETSRVPTTGHPGRPRRGGAEPAGAVSCERFPATARRRRGEHGSRRPEPTPPDDMRAREVIGAAPRRMAVSPGTRCLLTRRRALGPGAGFGRKSEPITRRLRINPRNASRAHRWAMRPTTKEHRQ